MRVTETEIYQSPGVLITNARCVLSNVTYATANISSVRIEMRNPNGGYIFFGIAASILAIGEYASRSYGFAVFALALAVLLFWLATKAKIYYLVMHTNAGEVRAISSKNLQYISGIVDGINNAIIHRG